MVAVPRDGVGLIYEHLPRAAFDMIERNMHAEVAPAAEVRL